LRQHSGTKLSIRRGKTRSATATPLLRGRVPIWRYGSCAGCSACSAKNPPCFTPTLPPTLGVWEHQQMTVETTGCARGNARMRWTTEERSSGIQAGVRSA